MPSGFPPVRSEVRYILLYARRMLPRTTTPAKAFYQDYSCGFRVSCMM